MTGFNRTIPSTLADRQYAQRPSSFAAGRSAIAPTWSRYAVLCVTSPAAVLLLSKGSPRLASNCNLSLEAEKSPVRHDVVASTPVGPAAVCFDQLMESIYD